MIEEYNFGEMVIDGETYRKDLIISKNRVIPNWWRDEGHVLQLNDISESIEKNTGGTLIVGTGKFGMMKVSNEVKSFCQSNDITLIARKTGKAVELFNQYSNEGNPVMGAFHLTC